MVLGDLVRALPGVALRRFDLLASLAAENADEASHGVLLPISANVAPLARFINAMTSAFLFLPSACGLLAAFIDLRAFFAGLAFLEVARLPFGCGAPGSCVVIFSVSIVLIVSLLDRVAVITSITPIGRNSKRILRRSRLASAGGSAEVQQFDGLVPFL